MSRRIRSGRASSQSGPAEDKALTSPVRVWARLSGLRVDEYSALEGLRRGRPAAASRDVYYAAPRRAGHAGVCRVRFDGAVCSVSSPDWGLSAHEWWPGTSGPAVTWFRQAWRMVRAHCSSDCLRPVTVHAQFPDRGDGAGQPDGLRGRHVTSMALMWPLISRAARL